jgi:hypothetical protein
MNKDALEVKAEWFDDFGVGLIKIVNQKHRNNDFAKNRHYSYKASNGIVLSSVFFPAYDIYNKYLLHVRGNKSEEDDKICVVPFRDVYEQILVAIQEYNETMLDNVGIGLDLLQTILVEI